MAILPYDPGVLPTKPAPSPGETISIEMDGLPPHKDEHFSIRNARHPNHDRFLALRKKAIEVMDGRAWSFGPIAIDFVLYAPCPPVKPKLRDFVAGIEDTLDGCSGFTFTFLPIVFEDDCQVCRHGMRFEQSEQTRYRVVIEFLDARTAQ